MSGVRRSAFQTFPAFPSQAFDEREKESGREKGTERNVLIKTRTQQKLPLRLWIVTERPAGRRCASMPVHGARSPSEERQGDALRERIKQK